MRACGRRCSQLRKEPSDQGGYGCLTVVSEVMEGTLRVQATKSASSVEVTTDGTGVVGHAGAALLRELADRVELTRAFGWREPGERRRHPDAAVLRDLAVMLADGGDCLSDLAVLRDQPELFGPVASTPTAWRIIERVGKDSDGLAGLRAARAHARARAWAAGAHPGPRAADRGRRRHLGGPTAITRKARRDLQGLVRVPSAAGLPGPRGCPGRTAGRHLAAGQCPRRWQR
jgi:hypothetical protein